MERRDEDWINPPEPKEEYEPDVDYINDEIWLRKKEAEEKEIELEELNVFGWELACEIKEKMFEKYPNCDQETIDYLLEEIVCQFSNKFGE